MLEKIITLSLSASSMLLDLWGKKQKISFKEDSSPQTQADIIMSQYLSSELLKILDIPVISEEDTINFESPPDRFWLLDPLDGTKEFVRNEDEFGINIALIENQSPVLSVIALPRFNEIYLSQKGEGSFLFKKGKKIALRPSESNNFMALISKSHKNDLEEKFLVVNNIQSVQKVGASLKFCYLALGKATIYARFDKLHSWDIAAGHLLTKEAGFNVYDLTTLQEPCYGSPLSRMNPFIILNRKIDINSLELP